MYEKELQFLNLNANTALIEHNDCDRLYYAARHFCESNHIPVTPFGGHIIDIFYDQDVAINPFEGVTDVPEYFHGECQTCPNHIILDPGTVEIGYGAFYQTDIIKISGPEKVYRVHASAFEDCTDIEFIYKGETLSWQDIVGQKLFKFEHELDDIDGNKE